MAIQQIPGHLRQRRKGGAWHYCLYLNGRLWERSTREKSYQKAKVKAKQLHAQAMLLRKDDSGVPILSRAIVQHVARVKEDGTDLKAERVSQALMNSLRWKGDAALHRIDTETLDAYQRARVKSAKGNAKTGKNVSVTTVNKEMWPPQKNLWANFGSGRSASV